MKHFRLSLTVKDLHNYKGVPYEFHMITYKNDITNWLKQILLLSLENRHHKSRLKSKNTASMHSTWRLCLSWCFAKVFIAVKNLLFQPLYI